MIKFCLQFEIMSLSWCDVARKAANQSNDCDTNQKATPNGAESVAKRNTLWVPKFKVVMIEKPQPSNNSMVNFETDFVDAQYYGDKSMGSSQTGKVAKKIRPDELKRKEYSIQKRNAQREDFKGK